MKRIIRLFCQWQNIQFGTDGRIEKEKIGINPLQPWHLCPILPLRIVLMLLNLNYTPHFTKN